MNRRRTRGYSLVEVLIATAITSVVLLTVVTLFYVGKRNVYAGKQRTYAVAVGTRVLEDLSVMTAQDVYTNFVIDDNTALSSVKLDGVPPGLPGVNSSGQLQFDNSISRDTANISSSTEKTPSNGTGFLTQWKTLIGQANLANATVGLIITPRLPTDDTKKITTAQFAKVRVYVQWDEGSAKNHRYAFFDTAKVNRQ